mgnify:CR=1 FL=1
MTNNVSGASSFELQGNIGKIKTTTTQSNENGKTSVNTEATKVSIFSTLDTDQSKHVSGEEIKNNNSGGFSQFKLNTDAAKKQAFANLKGSAINIANDKVKEMKEFGAKLDNMLTKFKSSKLFEKLSPDNGQTSVSQSQITTTTQQLDNRANTEFAGHANNVQAKLSDAMAKALAEIANEAKKEGQIQDIANAAKSKDKTVTTVPQDGAKQTPKVGTEQPQTVKLDGKDVNLSEFTIRTDENGQKIYSNGDKNYTLKDGALTLIKDNKKVEKSKENKEVKEVKDSKGSNNLTFESLKAELGDAQKLPIAGSPKGYKAQAWNKMINKHSELNGKQIKNMITEDNAKAALNRYLAAMEKN